MDQDIPVFGEDPSPSSDRSGQESVPDPVQDSTGNEPPLDGDSTEESTSPTATEPLIDWVREHPLVAVAAALGLGLVVGVLLARSAR
ncbi:hypothetical protein SNE35_24095 [Paucibacter sp. R3-3]|uniref:DUF883 domain-containing protein n=1 Tax=Roseateles agri TaxID=3098619 RepID=A0ABU5DMS7_9BURK|nr:hypothetical protein [Paucibacter sp. R3-3]MDY0747606.1 hypothetical protein [Paucibacter sp. R3-3]